MEYHFETNPQVIEIWHVIYLKLIKFSNLILFSATDDNEDDFDESGDVFDDAASSASTLPIAQACPNTLSVALRQEQINYRIDTVF